MATANAPLVVEEKATAQHGFLALQPTDILFGKAFGISKHPGNQSLRELIKKHSSLPGQGSDHVRSILAEIASTNVRFVDLAPGTHLSEGKCQLVSAERALAKVTYTYHNELKKASLVKSKAASASDNQDNSHLTPAASMLHERRVAIVPSSSSAKPIARRVGRTLKPLPTSNQNSTNDKCEADNSSWVYVAEEELTASDVIFESTGKDLIRERFGGGTFVDHACLLTKVFPQASRSDKVKVRVAGKLLSFAQAMDPPGRFLLSIAGAAKFALLSTDDAIFWICKLIDDVHLEQYGGEVVVRVRNPFAQLPLVGTPTRVSFGNGDTLLLSDHDAAAIMVGMHAKEKDVLASGGGGICDGGNEDDSAGSLATQPNDIPWSRSDKKRPASVLSPVSINTPFEYIRKKVGIMHAIHWPRASAPTKGK